MDLVTNNAHGMDCEECGEEKPRLVAIGCYAHDVSVGGRLICASCLKEALTLVTIAEISSWHTDHPSIESALGLDIVTPSCAKEIESRPARVNFADYLTGTVLIENSQDTRLNGLFRPVTCEELARMKERLFDDLQRACPRMPDDFAKKGY